MKANVCNYFKYNGLLFKANRESLVLSCKESDGVFLVYQDDEDSETSAVAAAVSLPEGGYAVLWGKKEPYPYGSILWEPAAYIGEVGGPATFQTRDLALAVEFVRRYGARYGGSWCDTPTRVGVNIAEDRWLEDHYYDPAEPPEGDIILIEDGDNPDQDEATIHYPVEADV